MVQLGLDAVLSGTPAQISKTKVPLNAFRLPVSPVCDTLIGNLAHFMQQAQS